MWGRPGISDRIKLLWSVALLWLRGQVEDSNAGCVCAAYGIAWD
jgi:hypothetical protein